MQPVNKWFQHALVRRAAAAAVATLLLFFAGIGPASHGLHKALHADSGENHHLCFLCAYAKGQMEVPEPLTAAAVPVHDFIYFHKTSREAVLSVADLHLFPPRAPPVSA